ncbi:MAG: hypothetical protein WDM87_10340 [Terracidiphilus sp.]
MATDSNRPGVGEGKAIPATTGFGWYRVHLVLPENTAAGWTLALSLPNVEDACEVYWNGEFVGGIGKLPPASIVVHVPFALRYPARRAAFRVLALRVWKAPHIYLSYPDEGGLVGMPRVGSLDAVNAHIDRTAYRELQGHTYSNSRSS